MANFYQEGQAVHYQYSAETINFGTAKTPDDFLRELYKLQTELNRATKANARPGYTGIDAESHLKKAVLEVKQGVPDKKTLLE